ncbi:MAG: hypothetical protein AAF587_43350 [Bacteroidota bacterium]
MSKEDIEEGALLLQEGEAEYLTHPRQEIRVLQEQLKACNEVKEGLKKQIEDKEEINKLLRGMMGGGKE